MNNLFKIQPDDVVILTDKDTDLPVSAFTKEAVFQRVITIGISTISVAWGNSHRVYSRETGQYKAVSYDGIYAGISPNKAVIKQEMANYAIRIPTAAELKRYKVEFAKFLLREWSSSYHSKINLTDDQYCRIGDILNEGKEITNEAQ